MQGKRFGYSLSEISKMLSMVNAKSNAIDQIKMALNYGEQKLADTESRIEELQCMHREIKVLKETLLLRLQYLTCEE